MTKIRFTRDYVGPQGVFPAGTEAELDPAFAAMLVRYSTAEYTGHPSTLHRSVTDTGPSGHGSGHGEGVEQATDADAANAVTRTKRTGTRSKPAK